MAGGDDEIVVKVDPTTLSASSETKRSKRRKKESGSGGLLVNILTGFFVIALLAAGAYLLHERGIVNIPFIDSLLNKKEDEAVRTCDDWQNDGNVCDSAAGEKLTPNLGRTGYSASACCTAMTCRDWSLEGELRRRREARARFDECCRHVCRSVLREKGVRRLARGRWQQRMRLWRRARIGSIHHRLLSRRLLRASHKQ